MPSAIGFPKDKWCIEDFLVGGPLGKGKYGNVYLAKEKFSGHFLVLKMIFKSHLLRDETYTQVLREIEIMRTLDHPNIVRLYGWFVDTKRVFLMLEFCSKGDLYKLLKNEEKLSEEYTAKLISQVSDALLHCHSKNIIHRDIKPENILLDHDGNIKLTDFGWSVRSKSLNRKTLCGTLDYLCPEMVYRERYNEKIDHWMLGVLTYELLVGSPPFESQSKQQTYSKISELKPSYPSFLSKLAVNFIQNLLQKEPQKEWS